MTVAEKKLKMDYRKIGPSCQNCVNFSYTEVANEYYIVLKNKRCKLGGFATTVTKWCKRHDWIKERE